MSATLSFAGGAFAEGAGSRFFAGPAARSPDPRTASRLPARTAPVRQSRVVVATAPARSTTGAPTLPTVSPTLTTSAPIPRVARAAADPRRADVPLTLSARGRRLLRAAAVVSGLGLVLVVALLGGGAMAGGSSDPMAVDTYTVSAGETLWVIASTYTAPHEDVRKTVGALVDLNRLSGSSLQAGEQILIPAEWAGLAS